MRFALFVGGLLAFAAGCGACSGTPKLPSGPPPEYEQPPAPSWIAEAGAPKPAPPSVLDTILDQPPPPPAGDPADAQAPVPGM